MTPEFRVSTNPAGERRWWQRHDVIPSTHTDVRPATETEAELMRKILRSKSLPSPALTHRLIALLSGAP